MLQDCLLDGSEGWMWWYAIGSYHDFSGGIPGGDAIVHAVELYAQMDEESVIKFGPVFQSGMVLQAGRTNKVWGVATVAGQVFTAVLLEGEEVV